MAKKNTDPSRDPQESLRARALKLLSSSRREVADMQSGDLQTLIHELQVHQVELQLQNEELLAAQLELANSRDLYLDLFDYAPIGYLRFSSEGKILEVNLTAAELLKVDRQTLVGVDFSEFVSPESQDSWYLYRQKLGADDANHLCELKLRRLDGVEFMARLESAACRPRSKGFFRTALSDISAVHETRRRLEESESRFRRLTTALTDTVYRVRFDKGSEPQTAHGVNCEAVTGFSPEEFEANPQLWEELVPPEDRSLVRQQAARLKSGFASPPIEHRIRRKDGQLRWVRNTIVADRDSTGRLIGYDGLIRDISERKSAEESLNALNATLEQRVADQTQEIRLLAAAMEKLGEGVIITRVNLDAPGPEIVFVNEAMCRMSGYSAAELVGQSPRLLQGERTDRAVLNRIREQLSHEQPVHCEVVNYTKEGVA